MSSPTFFAASTVFVNSLREAVCAGSYVQGGWNRWNAGQPFEMDLDAGYFTLKSGVAGGDFSRPADPASQADPILRTCREAGRNAEIGKKRFF